MPGAPLAWPAPQSPLGSCRRVWSTPPWAPRPRAVSGEPLHLNEQDTVRVIRETHEEIEVEGTWMPGGSPPPAYLHPS